jgi:hypothetical protein
MNEKINPVGLKGYQVTERMKELMGIKTINENKKTSVVELTKRGPDGNVYGIVRENHEYYIKITKKQNNLVVEDFQYMGGLQNKKQEVYPSYAKALKHLNLKFHSLNEAYGKSGQVNVFLDDKLLTEDYAAFESMSGSGFKAEGNMEGHMTSECCGAQTMEGMCMECGGSAYGMGGGMEEYDKKTMDKFKDEYGDKKGKGVYYATANKQDRDPETFEKNEGMGMMGEKEFPDLNGDGKVTRADILKGRGVKLDNESEDLMPEMAAVHGMMEYDDDYYDEDEIEFFDPGGNSALRAGNREYPCPTCNRPNALTAADVHLGYQCDACADRAEGKYQYEGEDLMPEMATIHGMMEAGMGGSKLDQVMSMISRVDSKMDTGRKPEVWVSPENENCLYLSAEDGQYFADYYGEMDDSGYPYIDPRLEAIADKFDAYWEWVNPGVVTLCLDSLDETQQAVHDMMEKEMTDKEKQFAALAEPKDEITYADKIAGATKKEGKLSIERAMSMMDEMIEELQESRSKKKI